MAKKNNNGTATYIVAQPFKDAKQYQKNGKVNEYEKGADVSDLDAERLESLIKRGIVVKQEPEEKE